MNKIMTMICWGMMMRKMTTFRTKVIKRANIRHNGWERNNWPSSKRERRRRKCGGCNWRCRGRIKSRKDAQCNSSVWYSSRTGELHNSKYVRRVSRVEFSKNKLDAPNNKREGSTTNRTREDTTWEIGNSCKPDMDSGDPTKALTCSGTCLEPAISIILTTITDTITIRQDRMVVWGKKKTKREDWTKSNSRDSSRIVILVLSRTVWYVLWGFSIMMSPHFCTVFTVFTLTVLTPGSRSAPSVRSVMIMYAKTFDLFYTKILNS